MVFIRNNDTVKTAQEQTEGAQNADGKRRRNTTNRRGDKGVGVTGKEINYRADGR
jgi:hypothetical protein